MGKLKRQRQKLHISSNNREIQQNECSYKNNSTAILPVTTPKEDLFAGLNIDFGNMKNSLSDDIQSVKSYKSIKSSVSGQKILPKREKIKLRRKLLLQKIDSVKQYKNELKLREKRKTNAIIGDTNLLHDALPSLESLLKSRSSIKSNIPAQPITNKGIMKASQRKKKFVQDLNVFKQTLKNSTFKENPFKAVSQHIKCSVEQERSLMKHNKK